MNYAAMYLRLVAQSLSSSSMTQRHHIIPVHIGGSDDDENFTNLTMRQHALAHLLLWRIFGFDGDKLAYKMLKGLKDGETHRLFCSLGGRIQGTRNAETDWINKIKTQHSLALGGQRAVETNRRLKQVHILMWMNTGKRL